MCDPTLHHLAAIGHKEAHGQRIKQFVGQHHAVDLFGHAVEPAHPRGQLGRNSRQGVALPLAHGAR